MPFIEGLLSVGAATRAPTTDKAGLMSRHVVILDHSGAVPARVYTTTRRVTRQHARDHGFVDVDRHVIPHLAGESRHVIPWSPVTQFPYLKAVHDDGTRVGEGPVAGPLSQLATTSTSVGDTRRDGWRGEPFK